MEIAAFKRFLKRKKSDNFTAKKAVKVSLLTTYSGETSSRTDGTYYMDSHASYSLILRLSLTLLGKDNKGECIFLHEFYIHLSLISQAGDTVIPQRTECSEDHLIVSEEIVMRRKRGMKQWIYSVYLQ